MRPMLCSTTSAFELPLLVAFWLSTKLLANPVPVRHVLGLAQLDNGRVRPRRGSQVALLLALHVHVPVR